MILKLNVCVADSKRVPEVRKFDEQSEFYITEGCHIIELSNLESDPLVSIARARVEPGVTTKWHQLIGVTERYVIQSGSGSVEVGQLAPQQVGAGDVVIIPPGCRQRISNNGGEDLVFLAICSPRFTPDAYVDLETREGQPL